MATPYRDNRSHYLLCLVLLFSTSFYFGAIVASAMEFNIATPLYHKMCQHQTCWPALFQIWAVAIAFATWSFVASAFLIYVYLSSRPKHRPIYTHMLLVLTLAMWLAVMVLGWAPSQISLRPSTNGIPLFSNSGYVFDTTYESDDPEPHSGMFHYAVAWYKATNVNRPWTRSYSESAEQGMTAMAAVVFCNLALWVSNFSIVINGCNWL